MAGFLAAASIVVINHFAAEPGMGESDYVELYLTDAPAGLDALFVSVEAAFVGSADHPLTLDVQAFDLLAHRGPGEALRVAYGFVPPDEMREVTLVFDRVEGVAAGTRIPIDLPDRSLTLSHDFEFGSGVDGAVLLDLDVEKSIVGTEAGLSFQPFVAQIFEAPLAAAPAIEIGQGEPAPAPTWEISKAVPQPDQSLAPSAPVSQGKSPAVEDPIEDLVDAVTGVAEPEPPSQDPLDPLQPSSGASNDEADDYLIEFQPQVSMARRTQLLASADAEITYTFQNRPAYAIRVSPQGAQILHPSMEIFFLEYAGTPIEFHSFASAKDAIGWNDLQASESPTGMVDPYNLPFDGSGIGIAIIDSGVDGTHPDLKYDLMGNKASDAVVYENYKQASGQAAKTPNSDTTMGHGTHVAGIMVGQATTLGTTVGRADSSQRGLAPGAKLYAWGVGDAGKLLFMAEAYDAILTKVRTGTTSPPIRVVQNSWSTGTEYSASSLLNRLIADVIDQNVVVVFSAGNNGGDGSTNQISAQCRIPREGLICVGGYEDSDTGSSTSGTIYGFSSRGLATDISTWPDLVAPATRIVSTRPATGTVALDARGIYGPMSGTSVAAPMVAATVALMLEVDDTLSTGQVACILKTTAAKFESGGTYDPDVGHFAKGHGLLDVEEAVEGVTSYLC